MFMTLSGKQSIKATYMLVEVGEAFMIPDLNMHVVQFFAYNI